MTTESSTQPRWRTVSSPTSKTLTSAVWTAAGPLAVGEAGTVVGRPPDGDWRVVIDSGPNARSATLNAATVSDDGERSWFAGSSGVLGLWDTASERKSDFSAPDEKTSSWCAITISGEPGEERLVVANSSGEVVRADLDADQCPTFGGVVKPGSGSTLSALDAADSIVYGTDTSGNVYALRDDEWTRIGIRNAQVNFTDLTAAQTGLFVSGDGGLVYRYDVPCRNWTPVRAAPQTLRGIDAETDRIVAVGDGGGITRCTSDQRWTLEATETERVLRSVALGPTDVAVGDGGTIVERRAEGER
ncbi:MULTISPECIES: hypothetical protein [Halomicrobium]|uniref:WD40 repeat domain-containing protein n=2 Tax=Halomicrobium mukohataei TaxID=57705 RepID=C7P134_HALMD|nr:MULTISPECIES: hypothetical protein [Halomicrobium]ACV49049.1 conserved hypothetical protein [Halomicrobium mukohataei DSM 12286]QCD64469.1 hypothetical protein E5139_02005 [Halomicrobium mukohataei]QFR19275.1 hypothetical protein GBQ70_02005 [Halomicrobium sp. ZPS1]